MKRLWDQLGAASLMSLLAIAAAFGLGFVFIGGGDWLVTAWEARTQSPQSTFFEHLYVTSSGEPFIRHQQSTPVSKMTCYNLDRDEIPEPQESSSVSLGRLRYEPNPPPSLAFRPQVDDRVVSVAEQVRGTEEWFLVADSAAGRTAYFEGFDTLTQQRVGYIGIKGFANGEPTDDERFGVNDYTLSRYYGILPTGRDRVYLWHGQTVRMIDFAERDVQVLVEGALSLTSVDDFGPRGSIVPTDRLAIRLAGAVQVYDEQGVVAATFPIPTSVRQKEIYLFELGEESLLIGNEPNEYFIQTSKQRRVDEWQSTIVRVTDGRVISERSVTLRRNQRTVNTTDDILVAGVPALAWILGIAGPSMAYEQIRNGAAETFSSGYFKSLKEVWLPLAIILLVTGVCLWLVCRRHEGPRNGEFWSAVGVVILFGLPGYIGYRLHRSWPRRGDAPEIVPTGAEIFA